ncbi:hypothetical protein [Streptomyces sp. bgisy082]|uniref:hypothetical protein n=1 Tax=Streptomyces sp. bgisy082 TaxID=3413776 RepID=UPI003D7536FC
MDRHSGELLDGEPGGAREHHPSWCRADHQHRVGVLGARIAIFLTMVAVGAYGAALWLRTP